MKIFAALVALGVAAAPPAAPAQQPQPGLPSYAAPVAGAETTETIHGQIASVDDPENLHLNDERGFVDSVELQPGAIIEPAGTQLAPGMTVTITGAARGSVFAASRIGVASAAAPQATGPAPGTPARGADLTGTLGTALDSKSAFVGQEVVLTDVASADGAFTGATLLGTVTEVTRPGQGRNAQIALHFNSLRLADDTTSPVDGVVVSMNVKTKSNAAKELGGALLGMLAGNALGKTLFGVSGGGIVGAFGGYLIAKDNRSDVVIPAYSAVTVRLAGERRQAN